MISLSQGVRPLLDLLQFRCGVSLEVVDASLRVVPVEPAADFGPSIHDPAVRERCLEVMRSGEYRIDRTQPTPQAFYPLRRDRHVVGVLIMSVRPPTGASPAATGEPPQFELAGQLAKAAIEHDLVLTTQITDTADRSRRLEGILRFLTQLTARDGERALMNAVIQAATVWFDVDCRVYRREGDSFTVFAALPGVDRGELQSRLDVGRVRQLAARRRISPDDVDLSWRMRRGELLCLPIGGSFEWVMLLAGVLNPEVETTFNAIAQVLAGALQEAVGRRLDAWRRRLDFYTSETGTAPERVALRMLQELAVAAGLPGARLSLHRQGTERIVAAFNMGNDVTTGRVIPVSGDAEVRLEFTRSAEPLNSDAIATVDAWIAAVRPWLQGAAPMLVAETAPQAEEESTFEQRIQDEIERAKRFDLNLGLVLIGIEQAAAGRGEPLESVIDAVRTELRASDLIGRVSGGRVAVLLVHAGAESADSVARRLRRRLTTVAREAPLGAVRLGQTMFSPERQTTHDLILDAAHRLEELHAGGRNS